MRKVLLVETYLYGFLYNLQMVRPVSTPAFYGYSGSSLTVSQNIAKSVNKSQKLARRQKNNNNLSSHLTVVKRLYLYSYNKTPVFINCARFQQILSKKCLKQRNKRSHC